MRPTVFQKAEIRDENDVIVQQGTYGKGSALSNSTNDAWIDYVMNNLEALYGIAKDEITPVSALPATGDMNKTYLLTTNGKTYRWSGTAWVELTSSEAVGRAENAATLAEQWATKTDGAVADNEYSAKHYSNVSKDWANKLNATVDGSEYSAKHYAGVAEGWAEDAEDTAEDIADHLAQIDQNTGGVSANSKRIGNIEKLLQGNLYDYDTDDDTAYIKAVPSGAMPYAGLEKVGGRTVVWNQLVQNGNFADSTGWNVTTTGATISVADNIATITYNSGTLQDYHPALKSSDITCYKNHKYLISFDIKFSKQGQAVFASPIANYQSIVVEANTWHKERSIKEKTTNTSTGYFYIGDSKAPDNFDVGDTIQYKNIMIIDLTLLFGAGNEPSTVEEFESMFPADYYEYNAGTLLSAGVTSVVSKKADTTTLATYPIPTAIRNLEGYGWSAETAYNYVDFERKVFVQNVARVDLGSLSWTYDSTLANTGFWADLPADSDAVVPNGIPCVCEKYESYYNRQTAFASSDKSIIANSLYYLANKIVLVKDSAYSDAATFKTAMDGVYLYYKLATPVETDISQYLTDDNLISVESGGTLTFPNSNGTDYQIPVPSEETYMIDLQEALS